MKDMLKKQITLYADQLRSAVASSLFPMEINPVFISGSASLLNMLERTDITLVEVDDVFIGTLTYAMACERYHYNRFPVEITSSEIHDICPGLKLVYHPETPEQKTQTTDFFMTIGKKVRTGEIPRFVWVDKFVKDFKGTIGELNQIHREKTTEWWSNLANAIKNPPPKPKVFFPTKIPEMAEMEGLFNELVETDEDPVIVLHPKSGIYTSACDGEQYIPVETVKEAERLIHRVRRMFTSADDEKSRCKQFGIDVPHETVNEFTARFSKLNCGMGCKSSPDPKRFRLEVYVYKTDLDKLDTWLKAAVKEAEEKNKTLAEFDISVDNLQKLFVCKRLIDMGCELEGIPHEYAHEVIRVRKVLPTKANPLIPLSQANFHDWKE